MATTGLAPLNDVGTLSYNGVLFSSLYKSNVSFSFVMDNANRTVKYVEWTILVEAMVTLEQGQATIDNTMSTIIKLLSQQGGTLTYSGKGLGSVVINRAVIGGIIGPPVNAALSDVAWGPKPKIMEFIPLGASRSASVRWTVTTCLFSQQIKGPLLQLTEEESISYDDEGYSTRAIRGTIEIPLRINNINDRSLSKTVDDFRQQFINRVVGTIDTTRFRITRRQFDVSRDKRTMEWHMIAEELPPMALPLGCTHARGTFSVRQEKQGVALLQWICSLKCTYTVRKDKDRRLAWAEFFTLMKFRMETCGSLAVLPDEENPPAPPTPPRPGGAGILNAIRVTIGSIKFLIERKEYERRAREIQAKNAALRKRSILIDFGFDEGLYLDSKQVSFSATWRLFATWDSLLLASGIWRYDYGGNSAFNWSQTIKDVSGWKSWLSNRINPNADVVVDLGWTPAQGNK